ncbi:hypothetical protein DFP72DRAFT_851542 [Ephemerocybe angulata]|uniref:Uncharacterized protein n=1 Tax=Ephemerocybe angulata TaxID=980116 RepID=A0A8H6M3E3_9AGAR|nr:hypothetical protein DFP72DRAFT_851542 [Tulosesus angulatus]
MEPLKQENWNTTAGGNTYQEAARNGVDNASSSLDSYDENTHERRDEKRRPLATITNVPDRIAPENASQRDLENGVIDMRIISSDPNTAEMEEASGPVTFHPVDMLLGAADCDVEGIAYLARLVEGSSLVKGMGVEDDDIVKASCSRAHEEGPYTRTNRASHAAGKYESKRASKKRTSKPRKQLPTSESRMKAAYNLARSKKAE